VLVAIASLSVGVSAAGSQTSTDLITNGGFENGLTGWSVAGQVGVVRSYVNSGGYSAVLGYRYTRGVISQQFTIPKGASAALSLRYVTYPEDGPLLTVALLTQNGSAINRWRIEAYIDWQELYYVIDSSYSGQLLTLTLISYPTPSLVHVPKGAQHIPTSYSYVYVDDVSVTSSIPVPEFPNFLVALTSIVPLSLLLSQKRTDKTKLSTRTANVYR
jgi:hypothetical protein